MPASRAPDWWCSTCNFKVFGSKPACGKCGKPNPNNSSGGGGGGGGGNFHQSNNQSSSQKLPDWFCSTCNFKVFGSKPACGKCGKPNPNSTSGGGGNPHQSNNNNSSSQKLPDWWCSTCNFTVFGSKPACRCGKPNPNWGTNNNNIASAAATSSSPSGATQQQQQQQQQPTWFCQPCQSFQHDAKCNSCGASSSLTMHNSNNNQNQQNQQNQHNQHHNSNITNQNKKPERTIDWQCVACNFVVFGNKESCRTCGAKNPYLDSDGNALPGKKAVDTMNNNNNNDTQGGGAAAAGQRTRMPDYNCPNCNIVVFGSKAACRRCGYPNPALAKQTQVLLNEQKTQSKQLVDSLMKKVEAAQHQVSSSTTNSNNDDDTSKSNQQQQQPSAAELQALLAQIKSAQEQLATAEKAANAAPATIQLTPPSYWDNISENFPANGYTLVDITNDHVNDDSSKMTYRDAIEVYIKECCATEDPRFVGTSTLKYSKVRKVSRIQNDRLWVYYCSNRSMMKPAPAVIPPPCTVLPEGAKNDPARPKNDFLEFVSSRGYGLRRDVNETVMFHGTSADAVKFIVDQGFDERVSSSGLFGSGCYNACVPSKAFNYIKLDSRTCSGYAFISRVVLGTYHKIENKTDSSLRRPPNGADCVIGIPSKGAAREFIVYDRRQIYPDLLIQLEQS